MARIRVLVVDDSALVRRAVTDSLSREPDIEVVGTAVDPYVARDRITQLDPDVVTLDIEMPRMDGITFLKLIMKYRPMPVIIMSSLTTAGSDKVLEALQAGAVEVVGKPSGAYSAVDGRVLAQKIRAAAQSRVGRLPRPMGQTVFLERQEAAVARGAPVEADPASVRLRSAGAGVGGRVAVAKLPISQHRRQYAPRQVILMGASTGGTEALKTVLTKLPADMPPIVIVQHIPAYFSKAFADRLNGLCQLEVREAVQGDRLKPGLALVAPGGFHMVMHWSGSGYGVRLNQDPAVHYQRPAVDVLFASAVQAGAARYSLSVILTGMGGDGAAGMVRLREGGGRTVAQDEESCVVFGMPREAIRLGGAQEVLSVEKIAARMDRHGNEVAMRAAVTV